MSAKHKLNAAHFSGALLVASGLVGWVTGSVIVFLIACSRCPSPAHHAGDSRR